MASLFEIKQGRSTRHALGALTTLGRSNDNSIRLNDGAVSAHHAVIREMPSGAYMLEDLGTTNGTFVGGAAVKQRALQEGDRITVGGVSLRFSTRIAEGTPAPPVSAAARLSGKLKSPSTALHQVKMTVSEELASVRPTWEMSAQAQPTVNEATPSSGSLQQDYDRLLAGYELIHAIVGEDDLSTILNRIVNSVIDLMSVERAAVLLVSQEGKLEPQVALQKKRSHHEFKVSTSILNYVVEHGAAVVCNDLGADERFSSSRSIIMNQVRSAMCVPMLHDGQLVGVLHMDSLITNNAFNQESLEVVTTIANTAAYAVRTAMLKEQIREIQRQQAEAMRAMISGASHFINNPLAVIRANLSMFEEWSGTLTRFHMNLAQDPSKFSELRASMGIDFIDEELAPMSKETAQSAARIGEIVRALYVFEHQNDPEAWSEFDVADLLGEVMREQGEAIAKVAQAHLQLSPAPVCGVRDRVKLLLSNLVTNAWQAIADGDASDNRVVASCHVAGGRVHIAIDDTGRGIPAENRNRIFAPFATDRLDGSMGLGLAVAAEVARQHQANLQVREREGGGTCMALDLLVAD
ncbi:MAG: GAF domain-containing protein [Myxococcales bacterium]|nr:GAF domain-containing protein [Myxococcales bacterium]